MNMEKQGGPAFPDAAGGAGERGGLGRNEIGSVIFGLSCMFWSCDCLVRLFLGVENFVYICLTRTKSFH